VHPTQVHIINEEFAPSAAEVEFARGLVAQFEKEIGGGRAVFTFKGRMIDLPVVDQARLVLLRHAAIKAGPNA
jgi:citrate lyase subunit beta/citryl-CoA lyase